MILDVIELVLLPGPVGCDGDALTGVMDRLDTGDGIPHGASHHMRIFGRVNVEAGPLLIHHLRRASFKAHPKASQHIVRPICQTLHYRRALLYTLLDFVLVPVQKGFKACDFIHNNWFENANRQVKQIIDACQ